MVNGSCPDGHVLNWQSQPLVRGMGAGNLCTCSHSKILFCGLTFTGISNLAKLLNLAIFGEQCLAMFGNIFYLLYILITLFSKMLYWNFEG